MEERFVNQYSLTKDAFCARHREFCWLRYRSATVLYAAMAALYLLMAVLFFCLDVHHARCEMTELLIPEVLGFYGVLLIGVWLCVSRLVRMYVTAPARQYRLLAAVNDGSYAVTIRFYDDFLVMETPNTSSRIDYRLILWSAVTERGAFLLVGTAKSAQQWIFLQSGAFRKGGETAFVSFLQDKTSARAVQGTPD